MRANPKSRSRLGGLRPALRALAIFGVVPISVLMLAGCDPSDELVAVENGCDAALTISIEEAPFPFPDDFARGEASEFGDVVAPGASISATLMKSADGFVIVALASDDSVYNQWYSFEDPERSFVLSTDTGTCPS